MQVPVARSWIERQRSHLKQADVLGQLVLAHVEVVVGHLHALDVVEHLFAGQQSFHAVEVVGLNVGEAAIAELVLQRLLRLLGD